MKNRILLILLSTLLLMGCSSEERQPGVPAAEPALGVLHLSMKPGETVSVELLNFERGTLARTTISGEAGVVRCELRVNSLFVTALGAGETTIVIHPADYAQLNLHVSVETEAETPEIFTDATPRFQGCDIIMNFERPGVMTFRTFQPEEWNVRDLTSGDYISLDKNLLKINGKDYPVETMERFDDRAETVDYIRIILKNNQEAWMVLRKEY
ncbi:MAG: hypothetical protein K2O00_02835 [Muribaculaceae bacterium]|nr:hypothetical protein [Muribaculaceae bacterium]